MKTIDPDPGDPRLLFRVFVARELVAQELVDTSGPLDELLEAIERMRDEHVAMTIEATRADKLWMVEVYDPGLGHSADCGSHGGWVRWGTDQGMMCEPLPVLGWDGGHMMLRGTDTRLN